MIGKLTLSAGLLALSMLAGAPAASAAPLAQSTVGTTQADSSLVQQVQYGYCRRWARECAARWGWRTGRFYRCMARHGC